MAYAKSPASYSAATHAWVDVMATSARGGIYEMESLFFPSQVQAKKMRFEIYGLISALEHDNPKKSALPDKIKQDRELASYARQWSISLGFNEQQQQWELAFTFKNAPLTMAPIFNAVQVMEEKLKHIRERDMQALQQQERPKILTLEEKLQQEEDAIQRALPEDKDFYKKIIEKIPPSEAREILLANIEALPNPFRKDLRENEELFATAVAQACGMDLPTFYDLIGMKSFIPMARANAGFLVQQERLKLG